MPDLAPIHHVKIPVSDVRASAEWYVRVLGLEVAIEFTEDGELRGVALGAPDGAASIALRHDPERAAALSGFDLVALGVPTRDGVQDWADHLCAQNNLAVSLSCVGERERPARSQRKPSPAGACSGIITPPREPSIRPHTSAAAIPALHQPPTN